MIELTVSILTITYNHELYIAQALDSFLMQKTNFDFEIIIGEDCSTDTTRKIIEEYQQKYPEIIKLLPKTENLGIEANFLRTTKACKGKYIAICDGDDYWLDENKLQLQVDFLETNNNFSAVSTLKKDFIQSKNKFREKTDTIKGEVKVLKFKDFLYNSYLTPVTVMFKNSLVQKYVKLYSKNQNELTFLDYSIWLYLSFNQDIAILNKYTGVYRVLQESASHFNENKSWILESKFYRDFKFYKNNFSELDNNMMEKALYYKSTKYYINACIAKDKEVCKEFLIILKENKDYLRYNLLRISLKFDKGVKFTHFIEKLNLRLNKKLLKNSDDYFMS